MALDPVTLAVVERKLDSIAREMGIIMRRTARSPIFSQSHDFSCFITDAGGRLVSLAEGIPIHTGGGGFAVRALLDYWKGEIHPGDVFLSNDTYLAGGNHLPDWTIMHPVFHRDRMVGFTCNRAHQVDIGGGMPGTYNSNATEIFEEGIRLPLLKLYDRGSLRRDVFDMVAINTRAPKTVQGDVGAMVGSTRIGARRLQTLFDEYGEEHTPAYFDALLDYAERMMRAEIEAIPDGVYFGSDEMNNDVFSRTPVRISATVTVAGSDLTVDFTGTGAQLRSFKNSSFANTHAAVYMALATVVDPRIPHNEGMFRPIRVVAPRGTVVNPDPPAPQTYSTVFPSHQIIHACWKALARAVPERVSAGWGAPSYPTMGGYKDGEGYVMYHWGGSSGAGAVKGRDGFDQVGLLVSLGGLTLPNLELYEQIYPAHFRRLELRAGASGAGQFRGGTGVVYEVEITEPAKWGFRGEGLYTPSGFGLNGGLPGKPATATLDPGGPAERPAPQYGLQELPPCVFRMESPAGGGWGDPLRRDPEAVRRDVAGELLSPEEARAVYGVVLLPGAGHVDLDATAETRRLAAEARSAGGRGGLS